MLKASLSTVGWFLTVEYVIGPILGFLILIVFPFLVIRSISRENKAAEMRRAVTEEVAKRLANIDASSISSDLEATPQSAKPTPKSTTTNRTKEEKLRKKLEDLKTDFERQKVLLEAAHLQELENIDIAHARELSDAVEKASSEVKALIAESRADEAKKLELSKRETTRKNLALVAKHLSSHGLPSWDTYYSTMEFLGGTPDFPLLTREMSTGLLDQATERDITDLRGVIELCHHLAGVFVRSEEVTSQDKLHFLTSCRWISTSPKTLDGEVIERLDNLSDEVDPAAKVIEAFSKNFAKAATLIVEASNSSKLREFSICENCGGQIEHGRKRCREACGYS